MGVTGSFLCDFTLEDCLEYVRINPAILNEVSLKNVNIIKSF